MPTENPFPLSILEKVDSWEKLQLLANIPDEYKYMAADFNIVKQALMYLYENLGGGAGPTPTPSTFEKQFGIGAVLITAGENTTVEEILSHINTVGFTVTAGQLIVLALTIKKTIAGQAYIYRRKYLFARNNITGTWGTSSANGALVASDLSSKWPDEQLGSFVATENDLLIQLGSIGSTPIYEYLTDYAGANLPGLTDNIMPDDGTIYYFEAQAGSVLVTYKFIGTLPKTIGVSTFVIGDFEVTATSGEPTEPEVYIPTEEQIFGKRLTSTATGEVTLHWNSFSVWVLTLTAAAELVDSMLPTGDNTRAIELLITGDFALDLPIYWEGRPSNDTYDGTVWNHLIISCINGNASEERVIYSLENLAT